MYAVIFTATIRALDQEYQRVSQQVRDLAMNQYGCTGFVSTVRGNEEITISYWPDEAAIKAWRENTEHQYAIKMARQHWYKSYSIQVARIERSYQIDC